jgi:diguanylate cyclase (GGDEF)-like protein
MKSSAAKPQNKAIASPPAAASGLRARPDQKPIVGEPKADKARQRSPAMRLASEVERLAGQLEQSRARIADLEARVDIDPLTELFNRRAFERELKRSVAYVKRYGAGAALIYLDLDGFKPVNDRHGHAAGDAVLKAVAAALQRNVRASDVVARLGGDEFVVLLWNVSGAAAMAKAAALERAVYSSPVLWGASTLVVGASAGVALIGALDTPAEVLGRADAAMYARKGERNTSPGARGEVERA